MFRAVAEEAIINRMGFNNYGTEAVAQKLADWKKSGRWPQHPVGINLGKSKITPLEKAAEDYAYSFRALRGLADFFVINVSSPNTPGLRALQDKSALDEIFAALQAENSEHKPILVKVAPDLTFEAMDEILELVTPRTIAGIVATNTTIARPPTNHAAAQKIYAETGGLSGRPLRAPQYRSHPPSLPADKRYGPDHRGRWHFQCWRCVGKTCGRCKPAPNLFWIGLRRPGPRETIIRDLQSRMKKEGRP